MELNIAVCCVRKLRWVSPCNARRSNHANDTGFSLRHFPAANGAADRRFFRAMSFSQSASGKNIAGVGYSILVGAGF